MSDSMLPPPPWAEQHISPCRGCHPPRRGCLVAPHELVCFAWTSIASRCGGKRIKGGKAVLFCQHLGH
ncbi:hypothetical protein PVAP13_6KG158000 [Panicum virgatum]|uniref:Uncharacterized protein n=1 Tax=Panicum virgatum TaxID=38727 RepID=A0A8T0RCH1_PANVG|nr:hypothetical protein PVAP13_6KG158000 [Panicum virgatum]